MIEALICYDIACPRRLARVHRLLVRCACPVQYSVFLYMGSAAGLQRCLAQLQTRINTNEDDIRAYPLPRRGLRWNLGDAGLLPPGIHLGSLPAFWRESDA